ncbi:MAG: 2-amino-4-hydroxy-6-hydroxymethyldihydropteridine diphosphokinase [Alphaproteobacteria bacterium]|jgi:2-amino-4-hydroxy-6-hydroxymethyldihydropteridine diphosphokinase|uniref:2-amino-4-hydroxy-6- hydroxymethyldihydropteridine diphosphokinase n=1 Tax=Maricaulis alexandrii TaxID=2570354 RepID=UPI0011087261|nr:2-amino-4-hydroxy-6-hydroxymethyldihydropteridine diphosphokinase [Maricaulis alexandrii]MCR9266134.1 2-amino-4-hydroxy-6-hydroxymethyldihydropteridine diphosphokinase [Alphaproteobacteria bacterium]
MNDAAIYIALGANLPSGGRTPLETVEAALGALNAAGLTVLSASSAWSSPAWPDPSDPPYVNAVAQIATALAPRDVLDCLHAIEARFGRERSVLNAPRPLDLDLIDHAGQCLHEENGLEIPHPRACQRAFVLLPLQEIAPDWRAPDTGRSITDLIADLPKADCDAMSKLQTLGPVSPESLAFAGREG